MRVPRHQIKRARIEIIPMIDTIFFLLVFFMIASLSMVHMRAIAPELPRPATPSEARATAGAVGRDAVVTVTNRREYYIGRNRVEASKLAASLADYVARRPDAAVVLNMSPQLTTQDLIDVMDIVGTVKTPSGRPVPAMIASERSGSDAESGPAPTSAASGIQTGVHSQ